eukprot:7390649-Prymnesium_polylepis.2
MRAGASQNRARRFQRAIVGVLGGAMDGVPARLFDREELARPAWYARRLLLVLVRPRHLWQSCWWHQSPAAVARQAKQPPSAPRRALLLVCSLASRSCVRRAHGRSRSSRAAGPGRRCLRPRSQPPVQAPAAPEERGSCPHRNPSTLLTPSTVLRPVRRPLAASRCREPRHHPREPRGTRRPPNPPPSAAPAGPGAVPPPL